MRRGPFLLIPLVLFACTRPRSTTLTISAAASVQEAVREAAAEYELLHTGVKVDCNFGSSGMLEQQIEQGAPVDVFLAAAPQPMDRLAAKGLLLAGTRRDLLRNDIVLIVPKNAAANTFAGLASPAVKLVALGDPDSVPAGDYGRQVLTSLGIWDQVRPKLVLAKDVRQVLAYVATGNADAGIVYATDAHQSSDVRVTEAAPEGTHTPVVYPVAVLARSFVPEASRDLLNFLEGERARKIFTGQGFTWASP